MALRTPLYDHHARLGATFVPFAGYDMPVHYGSIKDEHNAVRDSVGLFDVSHMSNLFIEGPGAADTISAVTPKDAAGLEVGKGQYSVILREDGTILDDTFYFRLEDERFLVIPNAGMDEAAMEHFRAHAVGETMLSNETRDWAILALQGPSARQVLKTMLGTTGPKFRSIETATLAGADCLISGTGYTGEKGVEIYVPADRAAVVWEALLDAGKPLGIRPIGLGARDTLRLEKGYCLAGHEFKGGRTPLEAGLAWLIDWDHDFLGKPALEAQKRQDHDHLWGIVLEKGIPREDYGVQRGKKTIGVVTSGTQSPTLRKGIGLAYLRGCNEGDLVDVDVRGRLQPAQVVKPPFV